LHIPDGFLSTPIWGGTWAISAAGLTLAARTARKRMKERMIPLMGVSSAFIFAAQMINFPVAGGTSGHLLGGVLAAIMLGPYAGAIVIAVVIIVQALVFQDGGLTAIGANIFNMAVIGTMGGWIIYKVLEKLTKVRFVAVAVAAWASVVMASSACAVELWLSGTVPLKIALPAMAGIHAIIGVGEAIITVMVTTLVCKVRPDLLYGTEKST